MDYMGLGKGDGDEVVDVSGEVAEASLVAHETVDVDQQKAASACSVIVDVGTQRLQRRGARIMARHGCKRGVGLRGDTGSSVVAGWQGRRL